MHIATDVKKIRVTQKQKQDWWKMEVIICMERVEKDNDTYLSHIIKRNGLKWKSEETKKEVELLEQEISDLDAKEKKLSWIYPYKGIV